MTTTASRTSATNPTIGHTPPASTAQKEMELTVYQDVLQTPTAPLISPFVVSLAMPTDVAAIMTTIAPHLVLTTSVTPTPMAASRTWAAMVTTTTASRTSATSLITSPTPHASTALRTTTRSVSQVVRATVSAQTCSLFVVSQEMTTGVVVPLTPTALKISVTFQTTLTPPATIVRISYVSQDVLAVNGAQVITTVSTISARLTLATFSWTRLW